MVALGVRLLSSVRLDSAWLKSARMSFKYTIIFMSAWMKKWIEFKVHDYKVHDWKVHDWKVHEWESKVGKCAITKCMIGKCTITKCMIGKHKDGKCMIGKCTIVAKVHDCLFTIKVWFWPWLHFIHYCQIQMPRRLDRPHNYLKTMAVCHKYEWKTEIGCVNCMKY